MSVNIFGSSGKSIPSGINKNYVDSKFITLSRNLQSKINKTGDVMSGSLDMGNYKISSTHIPTNPEDLINKVYGDNNYINRSGGSLDMGANKITSSYVPKEEIDLINKNYVDNKFVSTTNYGHMKDYVDNKFVSKTGGVMSGSLDMGNNKISNLLDPEQGKDCANKTYVDLKIKNKIDRIVVFNRSGLVPNLNSNESKSDYLVYASSEYSRDYSAYKAFNSSEDSEWATAGVNKNFWIRLVCSANVRIYAMKLRARKGSKIIDWKFQGRSHITGNWDDLVVLHQTPVDSDSYTFYTDAYKTRTCSSYRLYINDAEGVNPGLRYWQLFSADEISQL